MRIDLRDRVKILPNGCWRLEGIALNAKGYPLVSEGARLSTGQRVLYEQSRGPIGPKLDLSHRCRNRWCVNPLHMEPSRRRDHLLRAFSMNFVAARNGTCIRGHPRVRHRKPSGSYQPCRECHRLRMSTDPKYAEKVRARKRAERARWRVRRNAAA